MTKSTLEMSYEEWIEDRKNGIGGSDVATILGINKWKSPYQLWLEKTGQIELKQASSEPAYWGNVLEEVVATEFTERTGKKVRRRNKVFQHPEYPFLRANIDRDVIGENAILECKTANFFLAKEWEGDEVPVSYLCQIQHYMNVLNRDYAYIAVLIGGQQFVWKKVMRDQELIDIITKRLIEFWEKYIIGQEEPLVDGSAAATEFVKSISKDISDNEITLSSEVDDLLDSKVEIDQTIKTLQEQVDQIDNQIKLQLKKSDATIGVTPKRIITYKMQQKRLPNKKKLLEKYPEVAADDDIYSVSEFRVLREKEIG